MQPLSVPDPETLRPIIDRLLPLLEEADTRAGVLAREAADTLTALGDPGQRLLRELAAFDYDGALRTAKSLRDGHTG